MAIDYLENKAVFVEFLGGVDGKLKPVIYGVSAFDINAVELVEVLKTNNSEEICEDENGYCDLSVTNKDGTESVYSVQMNLTEIVRKNTNSK